MKQGDIILIDINGQYEFAHIDSLIGEYIAITTHSGAVMGGPFRNDTLEFVDGNYDLRKAGTYVPGYASACEHFGY